MGRPALCQSESNARGGAHAPKGAQGVARKRTSADARLHCAALRVAHAAPTHLAIGLDAVLEAEELPAGVTGLDTGLANVDADALTHG